MDKTKLDKYKTIYKNEVLPKKNVSENTPDSFAQTVRIYHDYSAFRKSANHVMLGCGKSDERK